jgi:hypothetical protein
VEVWSGGSTEVRRETMLDAARIRLWQKGGVGFCGLRLVVEMDVDAPKCREEEACSVG